MATSPADLDITLGQFARQARSLTMAHGAAIALSASDVHRDVDDGYSDEMTCRASSGAEAPRVGARLRVGSGFTSECVREGKPLRCDDAETDNRVDWDRCRRMGIRSVVAVPLKHEDSVVGIIEIFSPKIKAFTESHVAKLHVLAERVSNAVRSAAEPEQPQAPSPMPEMVWADVFVDSHLPWKRLLQSGLCHLLMAGMVWHISLNWTKSEKILKQRLSAHAQLTYFPPSFPAARSHTPNAARASQGGGQPAQQAALRVKSGARQQSVAPPAVNMPAKGHVNLAGLQAALPVLAAPQGASLDLGSPERRSLRSTRQPGGMAVAIVAPPPQVGGGAGRRGFSGPGTAVVAPSPAIEGSIRMLASANPGHSGVIAPPPSMPMRDASARLGFGSGLAPSGSEAVVGPAPGMNLPARSSGSGVGFGGGGSAVVGPAPTMPSREKPGFLAKGSGGEGLGGEGLGGEGLGGVGLGGYGDVVGPAPGLPGHEAGTRGGGHGGIGTVVGPPPGLPTGEGRTLSAAAGLGGLGSAVVPPSPTVGSGDGNGIGAGGSGSFAGSGLGSGLGSGAAVGPPSGAAMGERSQQAALSVRTSVPPPAPPSPRNDDPAGRVLELPVRVIGFALALPSSSFFSNYEVFIAEREFAKNELQLIKLVYESRATQRRLSEYGVSDSAMFRLRVKRDPTCDESAEQIAGTKYAELQQASTDKALRSTDKDTMLPCYRTTADDYQKALARKR